MRNIPGEWCAPRILHRTRGYHARRWSIGHYSCTRRWRNTIGWSLRACVCVNQRGHVVPSSPTAPHGEVSVCGKTKNGRDFIGSSRYRFAVLGRYDGGYTNSGSPTQAEFQSDAASSQVLARRAVSRFVAQQILESQ